MIAMVEMMRSGWILGITQVGLRVRWCGVKKSGVKDSTKVFGWMTKIMEVPFIEMGETGGAGLGGELSADLYMSGMRYQWMCKWRNQVGSGVGLLIFMSFSFFTCEMGKEFALLRILEIKWGKKVKGSKVRSYGGDIISGKYTVAILGTLWSLLS